MVVVDALFRAGKQLSPADRASVIALGDDAAPALLEILEDDRLLSPDERGYGWAPVHAAALLGELRAIAAIPRLIEIFCTVNWLQPVNGEARGALKAMGPLAFEPCLAEYGCCRDFVTRNRLIRLLIDLEVKDERLFETLLVRLDENHLIGVSALRDYGDARAIPWITEYLDASEVTRGTCNRAHNDHIWSMAETIEHLGGTLTEEQKRKREAALGPP